MIVTNHAQQRMHTRALGREFLGLAAEHGRVIEQQGGTHLEFLGKKETDVARLELESEKAKLQHELKDIRRELKRVKRKLRQCGLGYAVIADAAEDTQPTLITVAHHTGQRRMK